MRWIACFFLVVGITSSPVATVSQAELEPGMLFELRLEGEGIEGIVLELPPALFARGEATIEGEGAYIPLAVREGAAGVYTIKAVVTVAGVPVETSVEVRVGGPSPLWRYALPVVVR